MKVYPYLSKLTSFQTKHEVTNVLKNTLFPLTYSTSKPNGKLLKFLSKLSAHSSTEVVKQVLL
jgi:hypothetical protein